MFEGTVQNNRLFKKITGMIKNLREMQLLTD